MRKSLVLTCLAFLTGAFISAQELYFPPASGNEWQQMAPDDLGWCQENIDSLYDYLSAEDSKAFILLKDGKIVLEQYFNDHDSSKNWYWASAGKGLTSLLVGMAQQAGSLDIQDRTSDYLGLGWTSCTQAAEGEIRVIDQLRMSTGLDDGVDDVYCTEDTCLQCIAQPMTRWAYHNAPYTLLDEVMESATGSNLNTYVRQNLHNKTGMSGFYLKQGYNNLYISDARSMARFGLLMLANGVWDGDSILSDQQYFQEMINTSQDLNKSYGYLWWLNGKESYMLPQSQFVFSGSLFPQAPADMYSAIGLNGQFINVIPSLNMVWIRMGNAPNSVMVPHQLNAGIWDYIQRLPCQTGVAKLSTVEFKLSPNPASSELQINLTNKADFSRVIVVDVSGRIILESTLINRDKTLDISDLKNGSYQVIIENEQGIGVQRFVKL